MTDVNMHANVARLRCRSAGRLTARGDRSDADGMPYGTPRKKVPVSVVDGDG
ncbi:hypothetical protein [Streptomyces sp. BK205]|uniref:hypothetical protein n=1 Tax=Streptomyces sp. BK205 TaxID=2512164 RepID=UPI001404CF41|nr:hypothetical protein [Streptomyces sp. BK205]